MEQFKHWYTKTYPTRPKSDLHLRDEQSFFYPNVEIMYVMFCAGGTTAMSFSNAYNSVFGLVTDENPLPVKGLLDEFKLAFNAGRTGG